MSDEYNTYYTASSKSYAHFEREDFLVEIAAWRGGFERVVTDSARYYQFYQDAKSQRDEYKRQRNLWRGAAVASMLLSTAYILFMVGVQISG